MPSRRRLLATIAGSLAAVAGCTTRTPPSTSEPDTSQSSATAAATPESTPGSPTDSSTPVERVSVDGIVARKAVRYESVMGSGGVLVGRGEQYVVASVRGATELDAATFTFEAGGRSWSPGLPGTRGAINVAVAGHEGPPVGQRGLGGDGPSVLAFTVPSPLSAKNPRIRFDGGESRDSREWPLPPAARDGLAAPAARFELDSLSVPTSVSQGDPLSMSLSVTNVSETAGRFLAALYWPTDTIADDDESHILEQVVDAGETVSLTRDVDTEYTTSEPRTVTLEVRGHVSVDREVQVKNASTPS
ncbi:hypothetical protein [Salinigranum halophilum]|uniref:hypothetical protein n=1 Tax=Salinigranum halophilum TaxID=2565931 RepID=UPI0010A768E1|nr:hypothetical protein [Salinigranum halophilum]